jgi:hypothetical protein
MDYNKKIIEEIAKELNLPKNKVEQVTKFFFDWQRQKFIECENVEYKWNYFGKFKIIKKRYNKYYDDGIIDNPSELAKEKNKLNKSNEFNNNKNNNDYE